MNISWLIQMAYRDSRKNVPRLMLFMTSIVLGIAALVAINSFGSNLTNEINAEAKELLGADLEIESQTPFSDKAQAYIDSLEADKAREVNFASMVLFPKNGGSRLVQVRAIEKGYPFYGSIETIPDQSSPSLYSGLNALVDQSLLLQFNAAPGDSIKIGNLTFRITGSVTKVPGQAGISTTIAPPVFISYQNLESTGLLQKGSRIEYKTYLKFKEGPETVSYIENEVVPRLEKEDLRHDTVEERKKEVGDAYKDLTGYLNLVAFVALLLGCMGVASSVHIYLKEKVISVAILRSIGAKGNDATAIFLIQIALIGLIGGILGAGIGTLIQFSLPALFSEFLPLTIDVTVSWISIIEGIVLAIIVAILFGLLPLLSIKKTTPLTALRASVEPKNNGKELYWVSILILLFILVFSFVQLDNILNALLFTAGTITALFILYFTGRAVIFLISKYFPSGWSYIWRQSLSNLFRPNNQTMVLIITIGFGTALVTTLFFVQDMIIGKIKLADKKSRVNMILFDIQPDQLSKIVSVAKTHDIPVINQVPVVTMSIAEIKGKLVEDIRKDSSSNIKKWVLRREYRVTYRDSLSESEEIIEGTWSGKVNPNDNRILISLSDNLAEDMQVGIGDKLTFNVQGALMNTYVGSIRKVNWQRLQTNFMVVFPEGVLEDAPKFHVILTRIDSTKQAARFQKEMVQKFPNVSIIDLKLILNTVDEIIGKVSFVIRFMAFFSIATGIIVLIGSVMLSKFQRITESVILRTIGASRKQILSINGIEYLFLGAIAVLTGLIVSLLLSWILAVFTFNTSFIPGILPIFISLFSITLLTVCIGLLNSRSIINRPPLEVLRKEA